MKKFITLFLSLVLLSGSLFSCGILFVNMDTVVINDKEYVRCYKNRELLPWREYRDSEVIGECNNREFHKIEGCRFDCIITYDNSNYAEIYFSAEDAEAAKEYYDDTENYTYYCHLGSQYDGMVLPIDGMDGKKLSELNRFSNTRDYDPFAISSDESGIRDIPFDPEGEDYDFEDGEIRFYTKSDDGYFGSDQGHTYRIEDGKLVLLYYYDFGYGEDEKMRVVDVPEEIGDYFVGIVMDIKEIDSEEI